MDHWRNQLFFGDNLEVLRRHIPVESVDLIYLDPPFNSNATYNVLFAEQNGSKSGAQITAFEDTWHWGLEAEQAFDEAVRFGPRKLADLMVALRGFLGANDMLAYLAMMAVRLVELHRVLKAAGSLYLHCDSMAHPYLRLILDAIFGTRYRRNDIVWWYPNKLPTGGRLFDRQHDILLYYVKTNVFTYNEIRIPTEYEGTQLVTKKVSGKRIPVYDPETGKQLRVQATDKPAGDVWRINMIHPQSKERLGYPTQKPEALLDRIIRASSREGGVVLDPFCGCGTAVVVAERLKRRWIGIDLTHLAIKLIKKRLADTFPAEPPVYEVVGEPVDLKSAEALAQQDRHKFEWWALDLVDARPARDKKKGADQSIDGVIYFQEKEGGPYRKIIVQVKSGKVGAAQIVELKGAMAREEADLACFITLTPPTRPMREEAAAAGFYESEHPPGVRFARLQILTIAELFAGKKLEYPSWSIQATFRKAAPKRKGTPPEENQGNLL